MVSLSNERHTGGYFFNEDTSVQNKESDDLLSDCPALSAELDPPFRKINIVWAIVVEILLFISLVVATFILPHVTTLQHSTNTTLDNNNKKGGTQIDAVSVACFIHGGLWFILFCFDRYLRYQHYHHRMCGYLEFYRRTRHLRKIPFIANSGGNAGLLILMKILEDVKGSHTDLYVEIIIAVEAVIALPVLFMYLVTTVKFNSSHISPDVAQEEMMSSFMQNSGNSEIGFSIGFNDIGFKDENYSDQVLEKQADMIRYLKQHNSQLGKRILAITAENNALKSQISQT